MSESESERLVKMQDELRKKIIGQDKAIEKLSLAIQRNRVGLNDENKPIGSFLFLGPTGVGKTALARELAIYLFEKEESLIRIDMSEYMEKFNVSRLVGAPPGYVGYEEGGQLTEKVRRNPYSVVLFDEIEKAHPDVFNILLQILDGGVITDSLGRKVDFKNTIIILTSNIGTSFEKNTIGFTGEDASEELLRNHIKKEVEKLFSLEFLNRIDDKIIFNKLKLEDILKILDLHLEKLRSKVNKLDYEFILDEKVKEFLSKKGYSDKFGVRFLQRTLQHEIENKITEEILKKTFEEKHKIFITLEGDKVYLKGKK